MTKRRSIPNSAPRFVRHYLLMLLVAAYIASTYWPQLGLRLREPVAELEWAAVSPIHLMLAALLFALGLSTPWSQIRHLTRQARWVGVSMAIRAATVLAVVLLLRCLPTDVAVAASGFVLLLAMPSAASSSGWCLQLASSQSVCLALIVCTTLASAFLAPLLLAVGVALVPGPAAEVMAQLRAAYSFNFVLPWVLLPTLLGITVCSLHADLAKWLRRLGRAVNPFVLLLLNYSNGSTSLPQLRQTGFSMQFVAVVGGCVFLFATITFLTMWLARLLRSNRAERISTVLGTGMSNTGLALVVATIAAPNELNLHAVIIAYTFVQHLGVATLANCKLPTSRDADEG